MTDKTATPLDYEQDYERIIAQLESDRARLIRFLESIDPLDHNLYERASALLRELEGK